MALKKKERRTLGAFISGDSEFQTFHGILNRLNQRGRLDLRVFAYRHFLRQQPYCKNFFEESSLRLIIRPKRIYKLFVRPWFKELDALLVIVDPTRDKIKIRRRNKYLLAINLPTIFLQHGVIQSGVNYSQNLQAPPQEWHSSLIFFFEKLTEFRPMFTEKTRSHIHQSGFIKRLHITPKASEYAEFLNEFERRVLFAHSFRIKDSYTSVEISNYFQMVKVFAIEHPKTAVIMRPHRGNNKSTHKEYDTDLQKTCPNVFYANKRSGQLKGALMNDLLAVSDILISTPSTAILDAVYMDIPVAVTINYPNILLPLPQVNDVNSLNQFISNPYAHNKSYREFRDKFGSLDDNIEKTCEKIESFVLGLPHRENDPRFS